jgi:hypothetical protein
MVAYVDLTAVKKGQPLGVGAPTNLQLPHSASRLIQFIELVQ